MIEQMILMAFWLGETYITAWSRQTPSRFFLFPHQMPLHRSTFFRQLTQGSLEWEQALCSRWQMSPPSPISWWLFPGHLMEWMLSPLSQSESGRGSLPLHSFIPPHQTILCWTRQTGMVVDHDLGLTFTLILYMRETYIVFDQIVFPLSSL